MTWENLREMRAGGMSIGSHAQTHRILSSLSLEEQERELLGSRLDIERQLGAPVISVSYPVGHYAHFNLETKGIAERCQYRLGFSYLTGTSSLNDLDRFDIRRAHPPRGLSRFKQACLLPSFFLRNRSRLRAPRKAEAVS